MLNNRNLSSTHLCIIKRIVECLNMCKVDNNEVIYKRDIATLFESNDRITKRREFYFDVNFKETEVIGNIHDNPELLEVTPDE